MNKIEYDQNEDEQNGRQPKYKTTKMDDQDWSKSTLENKRNLIKLNTSWLLH